MASVYLLLGGNLGDRESYLEKAAKMIHATLGQVGLRSSVYETEPWGFTHEQTFLNQVLLVETTRSPEEVLEAILDIESRLDRVRNGEGYQARTIDIDLLFYDDLCLSKTNLIIPHPRMHERNFALIPMTEISPAFVHPVLKKTMIQLREECKDTLKVTRF
jgi:2-amino-4-hydroxy-6-hydroxymethyldihydropteridine diphosphokinase